MRQPVRSRPASTPTLEHHAPHARRDRLAILLGLATIVTLIAALLLEDGRRSLMPGPLSSGHSAIEICSTCHTGSGEGKLSWLHGLVAGDPEADSRACLGCHKLPDTAFHPHSASRLILADSTKRLTKRVDQASVPPSARAQAAAFPTAAMMAGGLPCATCHQEHQGTAFNLKTLSSEQCRSCHTLKFDAFDGHHPKFEHYPFKRRTRIIYDHAGHFGRHFPETAKKFPDKAIPATCSACHTSRADRRIMAVMPFEQTCASCHLDQIKAKEKVSGPKGIAVLSLPGLDLKALKTKKASIGEWPEASEAGLTPFMKVMISRTERGRALIKTLEHLNLQDLSRASETEIRSVTQLVWEIKELFHMLISAKASDVLSAVATGATGPTRSTVAADLMASIPRDAIIAAHQQWLPNLAAEMASRSRNLESGQRGAAFQAPHPSPGDSSRSRTSSEARAPEANVGSREAASQDGDAPSSIQGASSAQAKQVEKPGDQDAGPTTSKKAPPAKIIAKTCLVSVLGQCLVEKSADEGATSAKPEEKAVRAAPAVEGTADRRPVKSVQPPLRAGLKDVSQSAQAGSTSGNPDQAPLKTDGSRKPPSGKAADQTDDLLFPTEEEARAMKSGRSTRKDRSDPGSAKATTSDVARESAPAGAIAHPATGSADPGKKALASTIESQMDSESWAEDGGWYRQDYVISYRPTGHKDKFVQSWLTMSGSSKMEKGPAVAVTDFLTSKDAPGSCTKCHSVDIDPENRKTINFAPATIETKQGRFTSFVHEPHFGIMENGGCLGCHQLDKERPYLKSYERGNPHDFTSNFGDVKKELCQTCHARGMARQDCLLCHKYHVPGVVTPIMSTTNRTE